MTAPDASALSHLQPSAVEKTPRIEWVDAAKGIGIILVVIGHAIVGLRDGALILQDGAFHMLLFFFLPGIFIAKRVARGALSSSESSTFKLRKAYLGGGGKAISNVFSYLGIKTLPIDFIHVMFVAGRRIALNKILRVDNVYAILFFASVMGIAGPLVIKKIAHRLKISSQIGLA